MRIGLLDPGLHESTVGSPNMGDQIISRAIRREIRGIFGEGSEIVAISSHHYPSADDILRLRDVDVNLVGGSNLLWFRWWGPASWKIGIRGLLFYRNLVLLGVGWGSYHLEPNAYGRWVCSRILSPRMIHSVRDDFTMRKVSAGLRVNNVVNTACPTMWQLTEETMASVPRLRGNRCIFALTDYAKDPVLDGELISNLQRIYGTRLLCWPQGAGDEAYVRSLGYSGAMIKRSLSELLQVLKNETSIDYVGTRLHAGILCLEHGVRSLIVRIDNRAAEIARDTGLPSIDRGNWAELVKWAEQGGPTVLSLPWPAIAQWRTQFSGSCQVGEGHS